LSQDVAAGGIHYKGSGAEVLTGGIMLDTALLASIAQQMMASDKVDVDGESVTVSHTSKHRFRTLAFTMDGREYQAVEQNAEKPSRWGQLAREGHQVVHPEVINSAIRTAEPSRLKVLPSGTRSLRPAESG
jgi:hypothetical protein